MTEKRKEAAAFLCRYRDYEKDLNSIREQMFVIQQLLRTIEKQESEKASAPAVQKRLDRFRKQQTELRDTLRMQHALMTAGKQYIEQILLSLPEKERNVLRRYYVMGDFHHAADDLMEELGYEKSQIYRLRDKGLDKVSRRLDESKSFLDVLSQQKTTE